MKKKCPACGKVNVINGKYNICGTCVFTIQRNDKIKIRKFRGEIRVLRYRLAVYFNEFDGNDVKEIMRNRGAFWFGDNKKIWEIALEKRRYDVCQSMIEDAEKWGYDLIIIRLKEI